jgi:HEAT repeat protein
MNFRHSSAGLAIVLLVVASATLWWPLDAAPWTDTTGGRGMLPLPSIATSPVGNQRQILEQLGPMVGDRHVLEVRSVVETELLVGDQARLTDGVARHRVSLGGRFAVTVMSEDARVLTVAFCPCGSIDLAADAEGVPVPVPVESWNGGILVRLARDWRPHSLAVLPGTEPEIAQLLRSLFTDIHTFPSTDPAADASHPTLVEGLCDDTGSYEAAMWYAGATLLGEKIGPVLHRRKLHYRQRPEQAAELRVERGDAEAEFGRSWLRRMALRETLRVDAEGQGLHVERSLDASLVASDRVPVDIDEVSGSIWTDFGEDPNFGEAEDVDLPSLGELSDSLRELARLGRLDSREAWQCREDLIARLLQDGAEAALIEQCAYAEADPTVRSWLIGILGDAGGRGQIAAVEALGRLLSTPNEDIQLAALESCNQLGQHGDAVVPAIAGALQSGSEQVRVTAILAAGTLAGTVDEALLHDLRRSLDATREWAESVGRPEAYLDALANSGSPDVVAAAEPYLEHGAPAARAAAAAALGHRPQAAGRLIAFLDREPDPLVRAVALGSLGQLAGDSPNCVEALDRALQQDPDPRARLAAADALGRLMPHPKAQSALGEASRREPDPFMRSRIGELLEGHTHRSRR